MKLIQNKSGNRDAAVVVEAAMILPILIILTIGAIDLAQYINVGQQTVNASREASRLASRTDTSSTSEIENAIKQFFQNAMTHVSQESIDSALSVNVYEVIQNEDNPEFELIALPESGLGNIDSGSPLCVEVSFNYQLVRWIGGPAYAQHSIKTVCRRE